MFGNTFFGLPYFGDPYFGQGSGSQPVATAGGGYGLRPLSRRRTRARSEREEIIAGIISAVARQQIEHPRVSEVARAAQLSKALFDRNIAAQASHAEALAAERSRLISVEVARLLKIRAAQEDEALLMILAEAL